MEVSRILLEMTIPFIHSKSLSDLRAPKTPDFTRKIKQAKRKAKTNERRTTAYSTTKQPTWPCTACIDPVAITSCTIRTKFFE
jgi:hypothetical protein